MSIIQIQVTSYNNNYQCDHCKSANVLYDNKPPLAVGAYIHICPECAVSITLPQIYPYISYE